MRTVASAPWKSCFSLLLGLATSAWAAQRNIAFEFKPDQQTLICSKNDNRVDCDTTGMLYGGCAYNEDIADNTMIWCCYAAISMCWGYSSDCSIIGSGKTCRLGKDTWCCDKDLESCGPVKNTCVLNTEEFKLPFMGDEFIYPSPSGLQPISTIIAVEGSLPSGITAKPPPAGETPNVVAISTKSSTTTTASTESSTSPPNDGEDEGKSGLSAGAAAGIGIAVTAVVAILAGLLGCWVWRRKTVRQAAEMDAVWQQRFAGYPGGYPGYPGAQGQEKPPGQYEMAGDGTRHEVEAVEATKVPGADGGMVDHYGVGMRN